MKRIDLKAALERAKKEQPDVDSYTDYGDAWLFYRSDATGECDDGIVVFKQSGETCPFVEYLNSHPHTKV